MPLICYWYYAASIDCEFCKATAEVGMIFFEVAGGPYGAEPVIRKGPLLREGGGGGGSRNPQRFGQRLGPSGSGADELRLHGPNPVKLQGLQQKGS